MTLDAVRPLSVPTKGGRMAFRFELRLPDGDDAGTFETAVPKQPGHTVIASGNRRYRAAVSVLRTATAERVEVSLVRPDRPVPSVGWEAYRTHAARGCAAAESACAGRAEQVVVAAGAAVRPRCRGG